mgnify:FL=1
MINIGIVEDSQIDQEKLTKVIENYFNKHSIEYSLKVFNSANSFLSSNDIFDLLFFDIFLGGSLTGMDIARKARERLGNNLVIVFITSSMAYAIEGYSVDASAYIIKPITEEEFNLKMPRIIDKINSKISDFIILTTTEEKVSVNISDIDYIEVYGHYLTYCVNNKKYTVRQTLSDAENKLAKFGFFRINKFNIINMRKISKFIGDDVYIKDVVLKVSRSRKQEFKKELVKNYV